jgi:small multidrug resistance family-3 protein
MQTFVIYMLAATAEIAGCFSFWAWLKLNRSPFWVVPGVLSLCLFAYLLTLVDNAAAGRAYAAYGAVYIASSIAWLWLAERQRPDWADLLGAAVCLTGAAIIMFGKVRV